jgi:hypothetical protein
MRIDSIYISPVKSLALQRVERAHLGKHGILEDRRFFLIDDEAGLVSQREVGPLARVRAAYTLDPDLLRLEFPDGRIVEGPPMAVEPITARFFGQRDVEGFFVEGGWNAALSEFAGVPVRLVRAAKSAFDGFPVSICSLGSIEALRASSGEPAFEERRFRQNIYINGASAHEEDTWIGATVHLGAAAVIHARMADPRCVMITHNPETGDHDLNTLKMITAYRTDQPKEVNFGVYASVETPGEIAVGDEVVPNT